jgi:hypothetical protein
MEHPVEDLPDVEPPEVEPLQMDADESAFTDISELGQVEEFTPEPVQTAEGEGEPDIWDILSDTRDTGGAPEDQMAGAAVPGMGLTEDRSVIDFGSFDVGLDRPEPATTPAESRAEADVEKAVAPAETEDRQPVIDKPVEPAAAHEPPPSHLDQPEQVSAEKSRVEDREKDFFGLETEGSETGGEDEFLGDAIEEITFDMDESVEITDDEKPEDLRTEQVIGEEEVPADEGTSPPTFSQEPVPDAEPSVLKEEIIYDVPQRPGIEPVPEAQTPEPETMREPGAMEDLGTDQPSEKALLEVAQGPSTDEIRRIVEEKVEKVVWEVVPELAEVLIREAIEKIKGKP